jgi:hypothetical protein
MGTPQLQTDIRALEILLDRIGFWMAVSTALVVLGLILEYWDEIRDLIERIKKRPPFPWKKLLGIVGGVLVTVGVTGELLLQFKGSRIEDVLRAKNHQVEGVLSKEAEDAKVRSETLAGENISLGKKVDRVTALANAREAALKKENLATQQQLESERNTRLEMEASLAPRYLWVGPDGKGGQNIDPLKPFAGMQVELESIADAESLRAARELKFILSSAGWKIVSSKLAPFESTDDGVTVAPYFKRMHGFWGTRSDKATEALLDFLEANNWDVRRMLEPNDALAGTTIRISIGLKSNPYFLPEWLKKMKEAEKQTRIRIKKDRERMEHSPFSPEP